jgi:amino acid adenylation domain-containing protein/thioester reductase-like protein
MSMSAVICKYPTHNSLLPFYLAWRMDPTGYNYNLSFSYQLENSNQIEHIISSLQKLIQLKAYLRQTFTLEEDELISNIHADLPAKISFITISLNDLSMAAKKLAEENHNIETESAIKLNIVRFNDSDSCSIVFNIHHILMDGASLDRFIIDLNTLLANNTVDEESADGYMSKLKNEHPLQDVDNSPTFTEYINQITSISEQVDYSTTNTTNTIWRYVEYLPENTLKKLRALSSQESISFFNILLLAWEVFISKLYNQSVGLINYPVNVRADKSIFGCFINTITLPLDIENNDSFLSLIHSWPNTVETLKQAAGFKKSEQINVTSIPYFAYSDFVQPHDLFIADTCYPSTAYPQMAHSNLAFKYRAQKDRILFCCELLDGVFPEYFANSLLQRFFNYLDKLLINLSNSLSTIELTFAEEKQKLLYDFNNTDSSYPKDKTLVDLFDEVVGQYPNKIAVKAFNGTLTYSELNNKAEQLASFLMTEGTQPEDIVGILIDNRLEMIIAVMAVLKAGAAYLPLTHSMPAENLSYMLKDSNAKILLTLAHLAKNIDTTIKIVNINMRPTSPIKYSKPAIYPKNLAYVIYTSGTTGKPKGILVEHRAIINIINYYLRSFQIVNSTNCSKYAEFSFDASVIEIFPSLLSGATLHIIPDQERKELSRVNKFFSESNINFGFLPTQLAELFLNADSKQLQYLIVAGEKLTQYSPVHFHVVNSYGATETSVHATSFIVDKQYTNIPIGKPIDNVKCYVVDTQLNILPIGLTGELLVGGESLARSYLNRLDLTTEKFISNPFQTDEEKKLGRNVRLYKTGDLARWLPDGSLEYIGRNDFQVKIRGYRIELGEIESKLIVHPEIKQAIVIAASHFNSSDKYLVAYYTADKKLDTSDIYYHLQKKLPEYMIPNLFIYLDKLPLTRNGKIDRKALFRPDFTNINSYLAPSNAQERLVCAAFSKVLGLEKIGVNDDFFSLGGNSIKAITLVVNLQNDFKINVTDIFNLRTPKRIAEYSPLEKNSLKQNLQSIKQKYNHKNVNHAFNQDLKNKLKKYHESIEQLPMHYEQKPMHSILLTGATGFLGCNLLEQLLLSTNYTIFLLIRASSPEEGFERINKKFQFYFGKRLDQFYKKRLFIFAADIEENNLGLSTEEYQILASKVDSIIHSAALTKHYGEYDKFYSANVQGTINLLALCKLTRSKDFHYISTTSILDQDPIENNAQSIFTEDDQINNFTAKESAYIRTKRLGEEEVINYRQQGINSNIYRVGNLAFMANNYCVQENIEDNAFLNRLKFLLSLGVIAEEMNTVEISLTDLTAQAIVKLFDKEQLKNKIYHVFNPNLFNIAEGLSKQGFLSLKIVPIDRFIDIIISFLDNPLYQKNIERYLLHQGWLNEAYSNRSGIVCLQDRTEAILEKLGFKWSPVEHNILSRYLTLELGYVEKT